MRYFPIFIDSKTINCLIVGAGEVAARKAELLMKSDASITVVAPIVCDVIKHAQKDGKLTLHQRPFAESDLVDVNLVFVATNDTQLNQSIHDLAQQRKIQVNVVDNTPLCSFITPSIVDREPVVIAMSSGGVAPVLLRYLRQKLESWIPQNVRKLGEFAAKYREVVKKQFDSVTARRYFWESVFDGKIAEHILQGNDEKADRLMQQQLAKDEPQITGEVYLVGAGPGDPELLTFRALRLMQKADVVVYDRLVSPEILELVRRDAEKIYVGKAKSRHTLPQEGINALLVEEAQKGNRVVRLKGGDPFIFGRGGEEIETLIKHGIGFQVVPGVTAASGASSYAGIPLTHRDHAQSVVFATGHLRDNSINLNWPALAQAQQTLVFYMGLTGLEIICANLIKHGLAPTTPIALIESATLPQQKVISGTLATIVKIAKGSQIAPPTLIIVGTVVNLREQINWFEPGVK